MSNNSVKLSHMMSTYSIKARDLAEYFGVTRQTIYNYQNKEISQFSKEIKSKICKLFSVNNLNQVYEYYNSTNTKPKRKKVRDNLNNYINNKTVVQVKDRCIKIKSKNVSDEYLLLLDKILNDRLKGGNDYALLSEIDKR